MKNLLFICSIIILQSCENESESNPRVDPCPTCISTVEINGYDWPSKPYLAWFQVSENSDTFFTLEIRETNPLTDDFKDILSFWMIPYKEGEFKFDSTNYANWDTSVNLFLFYVEYGTAAEIFDTKMNGESFIRIVSLDRNTGAFRLQFNIKLYAYEGQNGPLFNIPYADTILVNGIAEGIVTNE